MSKVRRSLYRSASLLGDIEAVASGSPKRAVKRVYNKALWRAVARVFRKGAWK